MRDVSFGRSVAATRRREWMRIHDALTCEVWAWYWYRVAVLLAACDMYGSAPREVQWHVRLLLRELMVRGELWRV